MPNLFETKWDRAYWRITMTLNVLCTILVTAAN
jgi:hypothetical protein